MKIERVEISGLWGQFDIDWTLNKQVTILSGINGSGKSTILRAMAALLSGRPLTADIAGRMSTIKIMFDSGVSLNLIIDKDDPSTLNGRSGNSSLGNKSFKEVKEIHSKTIDDYRKMSDFDEVSVVGHTIRYLSGTGNEPVEINDFLKRLNFSYISTFDTAPERPADPKVYMEYLVNSSYSELDRHLERVVDRYKTYQIELSTRVTKMMSEMNTEADSKDALSDIKELMSKRVILQDILDDLMLESGKHINRDKGDVEFVFNSDKSSHSYKDLSAGEKQLLLILLTIFMQEGREAILIMDEPEISLHVDWQRRLLDVILLLNPNCQVIVSTHSPAMLLNGWHSAVDNISSLAKQEVEEDGNESD